MWVCVYTYVKTFTTLLLYSLFLVCAYVWLYTGTQTYMSGCTCVVCRCEHIWVRPKDQFRSHFIRNQLLCSLSKGLSLTWRLTGKWHGLTRQSLAPTFSAFLIQGLQGPTRTPESFCFAYIVYWILNLDLHVYKSSTFST